MDRTTFTSTGLQWGLWVLIMTIVMGWLGRSRLRARPQAEEHRLAHPVSTLILGLVCLVLFVGLAIAATVLPDEPPPWWTSLVFLGLALLSVPLLSCYFLESHEVSEEGLAFRNLVGVRKQLRWSELRRIRYAPMMKWFRLETEAGTVARVSVMLMGLPIFAKAVLRAAPAAAIDPATAKVLGDTAAGHPPSVWT